MKTQQTFQFTSIEDLWAFKSKADLTNFEVSVMSRLLTFEGTVEQFELAIHEYNATIMETAKERKTA
jgi:hypothetical protein